MERQNRNLLWILLAAALLLCCCCTLVAGVAGYLWFEVESERQARPETEGPVIVITRLVTPTPVPGRPVVGTPGEPTRPAAPTTRPVATTPTPTARPDATPVGPLQPPATATPGALLTRPAAGAETGTEALLATAEMPARDLRDLALRLKPEAGEIPIVVNATPPTYKVGDTAHFWVENSDTQEHRRITAELRYVNDRVAMWVEQGLDLDLDDLKRSADRFAKETYPTNREFFGSEWTPGVDNDERLTILHARGLGESVAGYYSSADEFSHLINPYSNEREMFYISADDDSAPPNTSFYDSILAHEFQHMIHWNNDRNEDSWVNEGMAELAGQLNGFDTGGADIAYSEKPDTQLTTWNDPSEGNDEHYGASYLFMAYFLDRFGEDLTKAVVASPENGIAGFNDALAKAGRPERFDDIFADWLVANYLDRPKADAQGRFGYTELDPYPPVASETYRRYPASASAQVSQYGADYIKLKGRGNLTIEFSGQTEVKLVDTDPKGRYAWWSNRGDDSDATLTRAFDLRGLDSATLTFSTWYDIEDGWDYAYVEVSTDGGTRWQILPGRHTTDENPVGNAFGPGWTGVSSAGGARAGDDETPVWVEERVDLTPFAGKEILLRFEYVTDDAVNQSGWLLDDIAIPELNYQDGGENGPADWQAAGWVLTDNRLTQRWLVQLVAVSRAGVTLERMEVGPDGRGQLGVDEVGNLQEAMLIISALAPVTTEPAKYSYTITAR